MIRPDKAPTSADIADHYDELDWAYRDLWGEHIHHGLWLDGSESPERAILQLVHAVAKRAGIVRGDHIVDVGCGYGGTARMLAREYGARVIGITLSRAQYAYAMEQRGEGSSFLLGDWLTNELPSASFDAVIAIESVEHMNDKQTCFRQARRVLAPHGRFVFTTWLAGPGPIGWQRRGLLEPICREGRLPAIGTAAEYRTLLHEAGFELTEEQDLSQQVKRTWSVCAVRLFKGFFRDVRYRRYLFSADSRNREFAKTLARMWLAYESGAMRYGLFVCHRA